MDAVGVDAGVFSIEEEGDSRVDGTGLELFATGARNIWERPPVLCSISSLRTIPMMVVVGISDCITFPGLKIMDTQGFT